MKTARPAPLLPVALAFSSGCLIGLKGALDFSFWLAACLFFALLWWFLQRTASDTSTPRLRLAGVALLGFAFVAGGWNGARREAFAAPNDLRLLPDDKFSQQTEWRGVVTGDPRFRPRNDKEESGYTTLVLEVDQWQPAARSTLSETATTLTLRPAHGSVQVRIANSTADRFRYGDTLIVRGGLRSPTEAANPGQFDIAAYLAQRDIYYEIQCTANDVQKVSAGGGDAFTRLAWQARDWALEKLRLGLEDDPVVSGLLGGMLLGYVEQVPGEIETAFRNTGTYHIFAVSGQNVAEILAVGLVALQLFGLVRWRWGWVMVPVLIFYCLITGGQPSAVRALLMAILVLAAWAWERPVSTLNLWSLALLGVMIYDPKLVTNLSFQLSFAVVGALIVITPPLYNLLSRPFTEKKQSGDLPPELVSPWRKKFNQAMRGTVLLFSSSVAAWIGSLPLMVWYFHQVTLIGLLANLLVVPLAGGVVVVGTLSLLVAPLSSALTATINNANWLLVKVLVGCVTLFSQVPDGCFFVPHPLENWRPREPEFVCAQTGTTTTLLIRLEGKSWLVNTGTEGQFRFVTNPLRKYYGVNRFDGVMLTELSAPQAGGAFLLLNEQIVDRWIGPPQQKFSRALVPWQVALAQQSRSATVWTRGHIETLAPYFTVTVLAPDVANAGQRIEDRGLVLLFRYKNRSLLYAGRVGPETEQQILTSGTAIHADILVQGSHGTQPNLPLNWLEAVQPREIILAAPSPYEAARLNSIELLPETSRPRVWYQEECGAVTVRLKNEAIELIPFRSK